MTYRAFNRIIQSDIDLNLPIVEGRPDIYIQAKNISPPRLQKTKVYRNNSQAMFGSDGASRFLVWPGLVAFELTENKLYYQVLSPIDKGLLRIFILSEALGMALANQNIFLLHGSAVNINKRATVFIGKPGSGKSTTLAAFASSGFNVIADDLVAIEIKDDKIHLLPAFAELKIWKDAAKELDFKALPPAWEGKEKYLLGSGDISFDPNPVALEQILILKPPYSKKSKELGTIEKTIELVKYWPLPHQILKNDVLEHHFKMSLVLAQKIKIENFKRPINFEKLIMFVKSFL